MTGQRRLYLDCDMIEPEVLDLIGGRLVAYSARCPGKDSANEDGAAIVGATRRDGAVMVADGMGGGAAGEQASRIAIAEVADEIAQHPDDESALRPAILDGIESANQKILELGVGAATTFAAVQIHDRVIRPYHVGDSGILVIGQRGKIKMQTVAHSPVGMAVEAGVLDDSEAMHHEDRHLVSNVVGMRDMRIEIGSEIALARFDTLLLATDGLFDNLAVSEIVDAIRRGPLHIGVAAVVQEARSRMERAMVGDPGKPDDLTLIAFRPNS